MTERNSEIDGLIDEHRQLMTILGSLQRAQDQVDSDVDGILDSLDQALTRHTEREEAGLFHVLGEVDVPTEYLGLFEHDHHHLFDLIAAARRDHQSVGELCANFESHMVREEFDMFPAAEQLLGPEGWDAVAAAVAHVQ